MKPYLPPVSVRSSLPEWTSWAAAGGVVLVAVAALVFLPRPGVQATPIVSSRPSAHAAPDGLFVTEMARPSRPLSAYARIGRRNLFKPLLSHAPASGMTGATGLMPQPFTGLPPLTGGSLFSFGDASSGRRLKTLGPWTYAGYLSENGTPGAMMENKAAHEGKVVRAGDTLEGARVLAVGRTAIRLLQGGKTVWLDFTDGSAPAKPSPEAAKPGAPATPPTPGSPPPNGAPPAAPAPGSTPPPPPGAIPGAPPPAVAAPSLAPEKAMNGIIERHG